MKNVSLGRYMPYDSLIHRMDPRSKLLAMVFFMVTIFIGFSTPQMSLLVYGIIAVFIYILMRMARISLLMILKQLRSLWFMMIFVLILNLLIVKDPSMGFIQLGNLDYILTLKAVYQTFFIVVRLGLMVALTTILTATTRPLDLTFAIEWYLTPFKVIKFPTAEIAMTISIALRFIPTLLDETDRIMKAQASRGVDFAHGKLGDKMRAIIALIIPLFVSAFQRSEELANALEARGYDPGAKRTRYRIMKWKMRDTLGLCFSALFLGLIITGSVMHIDLIEIVRGWIA